MSKKLLPAGKLKNLNDLVVGASVLSADGLVGYVVSTSKPCTDGIGGDIVEIQADVKFPKSKFSFLTYRYDGRSTHNAKDDIVRVCRPENSKVKGIKVWSDQPLTPVLIEAGNSLGMLCKLYIDTEKNGKHWNGTVKPAELNGIYGTCKLGKSGILSVKVWEGEK